MIKPIFICYFYLFRLKIQSMRFFRKIKKSLELPDRPLFIIILISPTRFP